MSFRLYKNDLSDIVSIIQEEKERGNIISFEQIDKAVCNLYGDWSNLQSDAFDFAKKVTSGIDLSVYLKNISSLEESNKNKILEVKQNKPSEFNGLDIEKLLKKTTEK